MTEQSEGTSDSKRLLIVEDEYFIAQDLATMLRLNGLIVVGPAASSADAITLMDGERIDFALLDVNLAGETSFQLAYGLRERSIPFVFLTGYDSDIIPVDLKDVSLLQKPFTKAAVNAMMQTLLESRDFGSLP